MKDIFNIPDRLETLEEFRARTRFVYEPQFGAGFTVSPGVGIKVAADGALAPYAGNTVVLALPEAAKRKIGTYQRAVYDRAGRRLSRPLPAESFHITLHDLLSGPPSPELEARVAQIRESAADLVRAVASCGASVRLRSVGVYCMAATSLVLGFEPADEEACRLLMSAWALFDRLLPLGYPLTPHVTLGYLRPAAYTEEQLAELRDAVAVCRDLDGVYLEIPLSAAEYMTFSDMASYRRE